LIESIPFEEDTIKANFGITAFTGGVTGRAAQRKYLMEPTCTVCGFTSGYTGVGLKTVIPARAAAKVDFRLVPSLTPQLMEDLLKQHLMRRGFEDVKVERLASLFPSKADPNDPFIRTTLGLVEDFYGQKPVVSPMSAGGGPMYQLCETLSIPGISAGVVSHANARIHAPNENIFIDDYITAQKFFARLVLAIGWTPP
jgi:acetylornithine deacetylase/succinyl-diaminopimelate desuccinylase-like protein